MYGKFYASTFTGSMYGAGADVFAVWGFVIANGVNSQIELNPNYLAPVLGMTPEQAETAIVFLCKPDENSRSKNHNGCRLVKEGQFAYFIPNHETYRRIRNEEERREYNRIKKAESRAKEKESLNGQTMSKCEVKMSANTDTDTDTEKKAGSRKRSPAQIADLEFIEKLKANPGYQGIDIDRELSKMDAWFLTPKGKRKRKTRQFVLSWLNRIDIPMGKQKQKDNYVA